MQNYYQYPLGIGSSKADWLVSRVRLTSVYTDSVYTVNKEGTHLMQQLWSLNASPKSQNTIVCKARGTPPQSTWRTQGKGSLLSNGNDHTHLKRIAFISPTLS